MHTEVIIPSSGLSRTHSTSSYTVRYDFLFDDLDCKYLDTDKRVEFKGKELDREKLRSFWRQLYRSSKDFRRLRKSSKLPVFAFYFGLAMLILGAVLLILGVVPIWGENKMSLSMIIASGIIIVFSVLLHILTKIILTAYYRRTLYPEYEQALLKAARDNLSDYIGTGLNLKGGPDGFRCIEFSYSTDQKPESNTNYTRNDTVMDSETAEMVRKDQDMSALEIFKSGERVELMKGYPNTLSKSQLKLGVGALDSESSRKLESDRAIDLSSSKIPLYDMPSANRANALRESHTYDHLKSNEEKAVKRRNMLNRYANEGIDMQAEDEIKEDPKNEIEIDENNDKNQENKIKSEDNQKQETQKDPEQPQEPKKQENDKEKELKNKEQSNKETDIEVKDL